MQLGLVFSNAFIFLEATDKNLIYLFKITYFIYFSYSEENGRNVKHGMYKYTKYTFT